MKTLICLAICLSLLGCAEIQDIREMQAAEDLKRAEEDYNRSVAGLEKLRKQRDDMFEFAKANERKRMLDSGRLKPDAGVGDQQTAEAELVKHAEKSTASFKVLIKMAEENLERRRKALEDARLHKKAFE